MKATPDQYEKAVEIYENSRTPVSDVFDFADKNGIDEWSICVLCDLETPDCEDGACLLCGSNKEESNKEENDG